MNKSKKDFRKYNHDDKVFFTYKMNHQYQTYNYAKSFNLKYSKFNICKMNILQAIQKLDNIIDDSDPDTELSQLAHAYQTAEALRKFYPENDYLHLVGLIHDLGKVLLLSEFGSLP